MLYAKNRPRETMTYLARLDPDAGWMRLGWEYYWYLTAQTSHMLGDLDATHAWLSRARKKFPESVVIAAAHARALGLNGEQDSMITVVREILQSPAEWKGFYAYSVIEDMLRHKRQRAASLAFREFSAWYVSRGSSATEPDRRDFSRALFSMNMDEAARNHFSTLIRYFPNSTWRTLYTGHLAVLAAKAGDTASARKLIEFVPSEKQQWSGENKYWRARVAAQMGRRTEAVHLLRQAFDEGYPQISLSHSTWFDFPTLQGFPPFEALVASDR
jgi:tetratricopeptide (TPR) repeat protein